MSFSFPFFAISEEDEHRSNEVMASLRDYLGSLPFSFQNASIISGQEEGLYGWITVNYLKGNFIEVRRWHWVIRSIIYTNTYVDYVMVHHAFCFSNLQKNMFNAYIRPEGAKTTGSMDLGGASTQIAFAVDSNLTGPDYMPIKLYGYQYNVYTHSFLCYGKNEAEKRILDKIIQVQNVCVCASVQETDWWSAL